MDPMENDIKVGVNLTDDDIMRAVAVKQVDAFTTEFCSRYGLESKDIPHLMRELQSLAMHRKLASAIMTGSLISIIVGLVGWVGVLLWDAIKMRGGL